MLMFANEVEWKEKEKLPEIKQNKTKQKIATSFQKTSYSPPFTNHTKRDCEDVTWWYVEL